MAHDNCARSWTVFGNGKFSSRTISFSLMGFIQIRTLQLDFGITTMGAYQSIGVVTDLMMFSPCIPFRSAWTFSVMGRGGRQGVAMEKG